MAGKRDIVNFLPNQRVDLPDFRAFQRNQRSDGRSGLTHLLFGNDVATPAAQKRFLGGFQVSEDGGGPSTIIDVIRGTAIGAEILPDLSEEFGVVFGLTALAKRIF